MSCADFDTSGGNIYSRERKKHKPHGKKPIMPKVEKVVAYRAKDGTLHASETEAIDHNFKNELRHKVYCLMLESSSFPKESFDPKYRELALEVANSRFRGDVNNFVEIVVVHRRQLKDIFDNIEALK